MIHPAWGLAYRRARAHARARRQRERVIHRSGYSHDLPRIGKPFLRYRREYVATRSIHARGMRKHVTYGVPVDSPAGRTALAAEAKRIEELTYPRGRPNPYTGGPVT